MTHGSLFSGIGGFDLAAEWMGWENKFHCEWNEFGQRVLHYYWPEAELFTDITKSDFKKYANQIDVLTGGFPCQPYSSAGKRLGKEDERHLWPEMLRAIREIAPRWVVGENVRGLTNWNGGLVFDEVCADLENLGYQVAPYLIPACATNAPHRRERIWFIAYRNCAGLEASRTAFQAAGVKQHGELDYNASDTDGFRLQQCENTREMGRGQSEICGKGNKFTNAIETNGTTANATNSDSVRQHECEREHEKHTSKTGFNAFNDINANDEPGNASNTDCRRLERTIEVGWNSQHVKWKSCTGNASNTESVCLQGHSNGQREREFRRGDWGSFPTQSPICGGDDGLPTQLDRITFPKWRNESIKAYGNAVVPQVVYQIFKAIESYERIR